MVEKHIRMSLEDSLKVSDYAIDRNISINKALNELIKEGLNIKDIVNKLNEVKNRIFKTLLQKIEKKFSKNISKLNLI